MTEITAKSLSYEVALHYCKERHLHCDVAEALIPMIQDAFNEIREKGFHEGKEFAILTIGNAITSSQGQEVPFLAYSEAVKALRK